LCCNQKGGNSAAKKLRTKLLLVCPNSRQSGVVLGFLASNFQHITQAPWRVIQTRNCAFFTNQTIPTPNQSDVQFHFSVESRKSRPAGATFGVLGLVSFFLSLCLCSSYISTHKPTFESVPGLFALLVIQVISYKTDVTKYMCIFPVCISTLS